MNRLKYLILTCSAILFCGVISSCTEDEAEVNGNVHGYVSDETTGEPIRTASVTLNPGGKKLQPAVTDVLNTTTWKPDSTPYRFLKTVIKPIRPEFPSSQDKRHNAISY